jgi:Xaa-Pro aminopeptidase
MNLNADGFTPKSELDRRIENLKRRLKDSGTDAALMLQNTDLFYFAGTVQQAFLYVPADGEAILMVRKSVERALEESAIERIVSVNSSGEIPDVLLRHGCKAPRILGMELDVLPANLYLGFKRLFEKSEIVDISHTIRLIRSVKSAYETDIIRQAAQFSDRLAGCVKELLCEGATEVELAGKLEAEARKMGHQGTVRMRLWGSELFYGHLMSGAAAATPSYLASPTGGLGVGPAIAQGPSLLPIKRHEPVLVDYCFVYKGYISDLSRIFSLGELPDELTRAHEAMLDVQALIKKEAKAGVKAGDIYDISLERASQLGYADYFMGAGEPRIRFVGHGVGLELDEYPFLAKGQKLLLQSGMVLAAEPKLIFPGKGVVGIENMHIVTDKGLEQLTQFEENIGVIL